MPPGAAGRMPPGAAGRDAPIDEPADVELVEETAAMNGETGRGLDSPEFNAWKSSYLNERLPSLFLDGTLKILQANDTFCGMYACEPQMTGVYFTQFYAPYFNEKRSADLFRSVRSAGKGFMWRGRVEKIAKDKLLNVSKVWIIPVRQGAGALPRAYSAVCLDITEEHRQLLQSTFTSLLGAARLKDNDTGNHNERVNRYARALAEDLESRPETPEVDHEFVETIGLVAALLDVGKIGTPDDILNKAGKLEAWEWDVMKQHTTNGAYILSTYPHPMAREIALRHHERWDGTGYPHGLSQDLIPISARIVTIADVYDALRMRRAYKDSFTHEQVLESMSGESGTHFDPFLITRFMAIAESFRTIFSELADPS
jgi:HD-GYP domain-containing protein (c-di-GMP phosphodiesterase class II)